MGQRGPRPAGVPELKLHGKYKPSKHRNRSSMAVADGLPIKPKHLKDVASDYWDFLVPELIKIGVVKTIDTEQIVAACESWELYREAFAAAKKSPTNKYAMAAYRAYYVSWQESVKQLGLSPLARSRLTVEKPAEVNQDDLASFARKRG